MASGGVWTSNLCSQCGQRVEVLNGDLEYSMLLHCQSHKSLETIHQEIDEQMKNIQVGNKSANKSDYSCPICKEDVMIVNNDIKLSLQLHTQKHKPPPTVRSDDQSSIKSKGLDKKAKILDSSKPFTQLPSVTPVSILEGIFDSMPPGLKLHKEFVFEDEKGKARCNICNITIESFFSVPDHLKTKSHEDNAITALNNILPVDLRHMLEFISFYGSNLCCNLCRGKIDLCSSNLYETIVRIFVHNSSQMHLKLKNNNDPSINNSEAFSILKSLAKCNSIVDSNKQYIDCDMQPQFKCMICDKCISYEESENLLFKNFYSHFTSKKHLKCAEAHSVVEAFNLSYFPGKENHNIMALKGGIYCNVCQCPLESNLQTLIAHVKTATPSNQGLPVGEQAQTQVKTQNLSSLLKTLPGNLRNTNCIALDDKGQAKCLVCKTVIPATTYNLQTHLSGKSHKNKALGEKPIETKKKVADYTESALLLKSVIEAIPPPVRKYLNCLKCISNDKLHCSVCSVDVPANVKSIIDHLQSPDHIQSVHKTEATKGQDNKISIANLLEKLIKNDVIIKSGAKFLKLNKDHYKCMLCESKIIHSTDEKVFKDNILSHLTGQKHKSSLNKLYNDLLTKLEATPKFNKADKQFLRTQLGGIYCSLCSCPISAAADFCGFKANVMSHLTGNKHAKNQNKKFAELRQSSGTVTGNGASVQKASRFFKNTTVEGYVSCTLCNVIINCNYVEEHLQESNHIINENMAKLSLGGNQGGNSMDSFISFLGGINQKFQ